jgi:choline dehydrogenase-like flavoprotein
VAIMQVESTSVNGNHFVGTCGIGRVLDEDLKVIGFSNLRVVDASAIPEMPLNSGPAASVYMLAEHISEAIVTAKGGQIPGTPVPHCCRSCSLYASQTHE